MSVPAAGKSFLLLEFMRRAREQGKAVLFHAEGGYLFFPAGETTDYCWDLDTSKGNLLREELWGGKRSPIVYIADGVNPFCGDLPCRALTYAAVSPDPKLIHKSTKCGVLFALI